MSQPSTDLRNPQQTSTSSDATNKETNNNNDATKQQQQTTTRKRTRATAEQLAVLEETFAVNVSPNSKLRKQLAERLQMSERSIQIWFQNRRAKVKHMQKRAQMQMQQASIRAQLYHYHQQQYGAHPYGGAPLMPLQPHQQPPYYRPYPRMPFPRAYSVDVINQTDDTAQTYPGTAGPSSSVPPSVHHQPYNTSTSTPSYHPLSWQTHSPSSSPNHDTPSSTQETSQPAPAMPTLVPVPDAGPTAMLTTPDFGYANDMWCSQDNFERAQSVAAVSPEDLVVAPARALSDPAVTTIDPSNLMMTPPASTSGSSSSSSQDQSPTLQQASSNSECCSYLSATTLTIGTWHRLKLRSDDLLCIYEPERRRFIWQITDNGCRFKMEIGVDSLASVEYIASECDVLADVHFDMTEPPLFYMEDRKKKDEWIQCSDFTEGKQASRFFRHSLKGIAHHLKQELMSLINKHQETRRIVQFIETPPPPMTLTASFQPAEDPMLYHPYWTPPVMMPPYTVAMNEMCGYQS